MKKKKQSASLKKYVSVLSISTLCALTLAACGGGGGDGDGGGGGGTQNGGGTVTATDGFAYIAQRGATADTGSIVKCDLTASTGALSNCAVDPAAGSALPGPISLALSGAYSYIVNQTPVAPEAFTFYKCSRDQATGALSTCENLSAVTPPLGLEESNIYDLAINGSYAYTLQKFGDQLLQCQLGSDGTISNCSGVADPVTTFGFHEPTNLVFAENNRVYVTNSLGENSSVSLCTVDPTTGAVSGCADANKSAYNFNPLLDPEGDGTTAPTGVVPTGIAISGSKAYIVSARNKNVINCDIGADGTFTSCVDNALTGTGVTADSLNRISVYGNFAYLTNNVTSSTPATSSVLKCSIDNGALGACEQFTDASLTGEVTDIKIAAKAQ